MPVVAAVPGLKRQEKTTPIVTAVIGPVGSADAFLQKGVTSSRGAFVREIVTFQDLGFQRFGHGCDGAKARAKNEAAKPTPAGMVSEAHQLQPFGRSIPDVTPAFAEAPLLFLQVNESESSEPRIGDAVPEDVHTSVGESAAPLADENARTSTEEDLGEVFPEDETSRMPASPSETAAAQPAASFMERSTSVVAQAATKQPQLPKAPASGGQDVQTDADTDYPTPVPTPAAVKQGTPVVLRDSVDLQDEQSSSSVVIVSPEPLPGSTPGRPTEFMYMILGAVVAAAFGSVCVLIAAAVFPDLHVATTKPDSKAAPLKELPIAQAESLPEPASTDDAAMRSWIAGFSICSAPDVEDRLPSSPSYDCALSRPKSSKGLVRLEGRVEAAAIGEGLTAPLSKQACVIYSTAVSRKSHGSIVMHPVAFAAGSADFVVSLEDDSRVQVHVEADDVALFDMCLGRHMASMPFSQAPDHWQDFILTHRTGAPGVEVRNSSALQYDSSALEFQECGLLVGTTVTLVGELHRSADGVLSLRPRQARQPSLESWRLAWEEGAGVSEASGGPDVPAVTAGKSLPGGGECPSPSFANKVVVSDSSFS